MIDLLATSSLTIGLISAGAALLGAFFGVVGGLLVQRQQARHDDQSEAGRWKRDVIERLAEDVLVAGAEYLVVVEGSNDPDERGAKYGAF